MLDPGPLGDVDILISQADARRFAQRFGCKNLAQGGTGKFRSQTLLRPFLGPVPVEMMSELEVFADGRWQHLHLQTRHSRSLSGRKIFVPDRQELIRIYRLFNREKDLARLRVLEASI